MTQLLSRHQETFLPQRKSACLNRLNTERTWERALAVKVGPHHVGVRVDSASTAAELDGLLGDRRSPELDPAAPPNFSIEMPDVPSGRTRGLNLVYRDHAVVARRKDRQSLLLDVLELLTEIETTMATSEVVVHATALAFPDGRAALLPWQWHTPLLSLRSSLSRRGIDLLTARGHVLDAAGHLVTQQVANGFRRRQRRELDIDLWGLAHPLTSEPSPMRPAAGVHAAVKDIANIERAGAAIALRRLASLSVRFLAVPTEAAVTTLARILSLAESPKRAGD